MALGPALVAVGPDLRRGVRGVEVVEEEEGKAMPKVKGETVYVGGVKFFREVHVDAGGNFKAKLPLDVAADLGKDAVSASTLAACLSQWDMAKLEYENLKTTARKVIHYHLEMTVSLDGLHRNDLHFTEGVALDLGVAVYNERKLFSRGTTNTALYRYDHVPSKIPVTFKPHTPVTYGGRPVEHLLPWTQEREDWFVGLCGAYEKLLRGLAELFKSEEALTEGISKGRLLMGGGE